MKIEEKIFKDFRSAVERKDNDAVEGLRNVLCKISDLKSKTYPKTPTEIEVSNMLSEYKEDNYYASKYIIPDAERIMAETFAEDIYNQTKGIFVLEEFLDKVREIAIQKRNLNLN